MFRHLYLMRVEQTASVEGNRLKRFTSLTD
jgi:hypothetical protein